MTTAHIPPHIPNSVNHYPSDIGYSHSSEGCQVSSDTRGGAHAGLNCCPHQQWHWGQTHIHTRHLTTAPTSSGTGGRRTTHRGKCVEWCLVEGERMGGETCQRHDNDSGCESVSVGEQQPPSTQTVTHTRRERENINSTHAVCAGECQRGIVQRALSKCQRSKVTVKGQ